MTDQIQNLESQIGELSAQLQKLRAQQEPEKISDYPLRDYNGNTSLLKLFGDKNDLIAIHNMGQGCRYCTTWADGFNGFVSHLEDRFSLVLLSKDEPELQRRFANSRGWKFRLASHGGGAYMQEQCVIPGAGNMPGLVWYKREGDEIFRKNRTVFGPGDQFCSLWHILSLGGFGEHNTIIGKDQKHLMMAEKIFFST
jgi:predicted dithiol-disulfide oxidoreductase (DUF899 family)